MFCLNEQSAICIFIVEAQILHYLYNLYANACGLQQVKGQHISTPFLFFAAFPFSRDKA